ncbi:MAG: adenosine deaminase [Spirochaetes bacterium]|nr:adenosine deaminase [Spirochaetota bacterium]
MSKQEQKFFFAHFPKVELHRHLEGTFDLPTWHHIALKNGLDVPKKFSDFKKFVQFPKESKPDFQLFLSKFKNDWYRSYDDVYNITYASVKNLKSDGIFYIELRFSPEHFSLQNNYDRREITRLIVEAGNKAAEEAGFRIKYLITLNRGKQDQEGMYNLYKAIVSLNLTDIVGIDLAGDEQNFPIHLFRNLFTRIQKDNIYKTTIHAGEVTPSSEIWAAIELGASRIGHGTATITDPALQKVLKERFIVLEQCITSNYQTGSWPDETNHPLGRLYRLGVPVSINSDDPTIQDTDLSDDYVKASTYFQFELQDFIALNLTALNASFLPEREKEALKKEYEREVRRFEEKVISQR